MIPAIMRIITMTTIRLIKNNKKDINNTNNDMKNNDIYIYNEFLLPRGPLHFLSQLRSNFCQQIASCFQLWDLGGCENPQFLLVNLLDWFDSLQATWEQKLLPSLRKMMCSLSYPPVAYCETFNS